MSLNLSSVDFCCCPSIELNCWLYLLTDLWPACFSFCILQPQLHVGVRTQNLSVQTEPAGGLLLLQCLLTGRMMDGDGFRRWCQALATSPAYTTAIRADQQETISTDITQPQHRKFIVYRYLSRENSQLQVWPGQEAPAKRKVKINKIKIKNVQ